MSDVVTDGHDGWVNTLRVAVDPIGRILLLADKGGPHIVASLSARRARKLGDCILRAADIAEGSEMRDLAIRHELNEDETRDLAGGQPSGWRRILPKSTRTP